MPAIELKRRGFKAPLLLAPILEWHWGEALISFEGYDETLSSFPPSDLSLENFWLSSHKGWVAGVRQVLPYPQGIYTSTQHLMQCLWQSHAPSFTHHGDLPEHPLIARIPAGFPGEGLILVANVGLLVRGRLRIGGEVGKEQQDVLLRQAELEQLRLLGYVPKKEDL